jgi:hypothetical protein
VPTLFVRGELSPKYLHLIVDILAQQLPRSEQVTIQGATHDLGRATKADIFNSKVIEFWRGILKFLENRPAPFHSFCSNQNKKERIICVLDLERLLTFP